MYDYSSAGGVLDTKNERCIVIHEYSAVEILLFTKRLLWVIVGSGGLSVIDTLSCNEPEGNCYEAALELFLRFNTDLPTGPKLVHGRVHGQGRLKGISFGHAWVEVGDVVFDYSNGGKLIMRRDHYYQMGKIEEVEKYTFSQLFEHIERTGHMGPWDQRFMHPEPV